VSRAGDVQDRHFLSLDRVNPLKVIKILLYGRFLSGKSFNVRRPSTVYCDFVGVVLCFIRRRESVAK